MVLFLWFTEIVGGTETPYEGGVFTLEIKVPERYFLKSLTVVDVLSLPFFASQTFA